MNRFVSALLIAIAFSLFAVPEVAYPATSAQPSGQLAQSASPAIAGQAAKAANSSAGVTKLSANESYSEYDVTGDGVADEIAITTKSVMRTGTTFTSAYLTGLTVTVNGKQALSLGEKVFDTGHDGYELSIVSLKNGKKYLYVESKWYNRLDGVNRLYQYKDGKFAVAFDLLKTLDSSVGVYKDGSPTRSYGFRSPSLEGVSGNSVRFRGLFAQSMVGVAYFNYKVSYKKGVLAVSPRTSKIDVSYRYGKKSLKARRSITAYKSATGSKKAFAIKKGQSIKVSKIYVKNKKVRVKVKCAGRTGWIKLVRCKGQMKCGSSWNKYFANITVAG